MPSCPGSRRRQFFPIPDCGISLQIGPGLPTVLRDDYILALKVLTNNARTEPFIRVMAKAQEFTASVDYADFDACVRELDRRNAFRESEEARPAMDL